jgi:hypothetical protein
MTEILVSRAAQWGGVFTSTDAKLAGVDRNALARMVKQGVATRVAPRAYVLCADAARARTPEAAHALLARAMVRSFDGRVAASHHSALALIGLPFWQVDADAVHVCRRSGRSGRVRGQLHIHESVPRSFLKVATRASTPCVSPALAVIGTAMVDGVEAGLVAADAALHRGLVTLEQLDGALALCQRVPAVTRARQAMALVDPRCESVGETRTRLVLTGLPGRPRVQSQYSVRDHFGSEVARVDFLVGRRVVVEFDGRLKYGLEGRPEVALWREKRREDRLRELGYIVVRVVWADLERPDLVAQRVLAALRLAESSAAGRR